MGDNVSFVDVKSNEFKEAVTDIVHDVLLEYERTRYEKSVNYYTRLNGERLLRGVKSSRQLDLVVNEAVEQLKKEFNRQYLTQNIQDQTNDL